MEILYDKALRESVFNKILDLVKYDVSYDFWNKYFQEEMAQRKTMKQDFTPPNVADFLAQLTEKIGNDNATDNGMRYEGAAGTGSLIIAKWHRDRMKNCPFCYRPSNYVYICEELSERAFPFLVFNMAIRGMNGAAVHCDVLTRECHGVFFMSNDTDNVTSFSSVNVMPYSKQAENYFKVKFVDEKYKPLVESPLIEHMFKEADT